MGFPKPWPTRWPDQPTFPDEYPGHDEQNPDADPDRGGDDEEPQPQPELRLRAVTWAITHPCNLRCTHCYDVTAERREDLDTPSALAVVDRLAEAGVGFIAFSGGEAFLRKDVFELMARARARGLDIGARSNGTRITRDVARALAALDAGVVGVSFDGARAETHDAVRGAGAFEAASAGVRALVEAGVRAQVEVVLSAANLHECADFIALGERLGASEVNFSTMTPHGRAQRRRAELLDHASWGRVVAELGALSRGARTAVSPNCALLGECCVNVEPHVTCDGWVTPCYLSTEKLFAVLETPPDEFAPRLAATRGKYLDVCGREAWTKAGAPKARGLRVL